VNRILHGLVEDMTAATPARLLAVTEDIVHATFFLMDNRAVDGIDLEVHGGVSSSLKR